jgi:hypothetical protein
MNCIRICGAFELALRGHDEIIPSQNRGIFFRGLVDFVADQDGAMKEHLKNASVFKGTSKTIQHELSTTLPSTPSPSTSNTSPLLKWDSEEVSSTDEAVDETPKTPTKRAANENVRSPGPESQGPTRKRKRFTTIIFFY